MVRLQLPPALPNLECRVRSAKLANTNQMRNAEYGVRNGQAAHRFESHSAFRTPNSAFRSFRNSHSAFGTPGGEIESRLAYTQKSEGQGDQAVQGPMSKVQC